MSNCATCRYGLKHANPKVDTLECRRHPPTILDHGRYNTVFPTVFAEMWCGEWQPIPQRAPAGFTAETGPG